MWALPQLFPLCINEKKTPTIRADGEVMAVTLEGNLNCRVSLGEQVIQQQQQP